MDAQLEELKRLCAAATPGPWVAVDYRDYSGNGEQWYVDTTKARADIYNDDGDITPNYRDPDRQRADMQFVAAANPATVSDLITQLEKALVDAERYRWLKKHHYGDDPHATRIIAIGGGIDEAIDAARVQGEKG